MPDTTCKVIPVPLGITHRGLNGDSKQSRNIYEAPPACRVLPRPCRDGEVTRGPRPLKGLALFREGGQARNTPAPRPEIPIDSMSLHITGSGFQTNRQMTPLSHTHRPLRCQLRLIYVHYHRQLRGRPRFACSLSDLTKTRAGFQGRGPSTPGGVSTFLSSSC